jgi:hypothetical protein
MNSPLMPGMKNQLAAQHLRMNFLLLMCEIEQIRRLERLDKNNT